MERTTSVCSVRAILRSGVLPKSAPVRFLIVEALALMPVEVISSSLKKILQNKQFLSNLDECT